MRPLTITSVTLALILTPAAGQTGNPAGNDPVTRESAPGIPAPHQTNVPDRLFVRLIAAGGIAEMNAARLATRKTQHSAVKEFAQRMADDHSSANARLAAIAKQARVPLPSESDPDHRAMEDRLQQTTGTQFDLDYMREQLVDHQKTAQLLAWEIDSGEDGDLRQFASETLPIIYHHLRMTQDILDQLAGQTPQGTGQRPAASPQ